jgi:hypothetical protein
MRLALLWTSMLVAGCSKDAEDTDPRPGDTDEAPSDADEDGIPASEDCDDGDPSVGGPSSWYADADRDGHGAGEAVEACDPPADHVTAGGDCDDADPDANPDAEEACDPDDVDEDCDGAADGASAVGSATWFLDEDGDGHGVPTTTAEACDAPAGYAAASDDCDDGAADAHPGGDEVCGDTVDQDCDGVTACVYTRDDADLHVTSGSSTGYITSRIEVWPDRDGDGDDELVVSDSEAVYVMPGGATTDLVADIDADAIVSSTSLGSRAALAAGDFDGDGVAELAIGGPGVSDLAVNGGGAWIVQDTISGASTLSSAWARFTSGTYNAEVGDAIGNAGDIDGDGTDDLAVAYGNYATGHGLVYLLTDVAAGQRDIASAASATLYGEGGASHAMASPSLDHADFDGDGRGDLVIGTGGQSGDVYVVLAPGTGIYDLGTADVILTGTSANDQAGCAVVVADDADGDGTPDLFVGAYGVDGSGYEDGGAVYVLSGASLESGALGWVYDGRIDAQSSLAQLTALDSLAQGDVDEDGRSDLLVGAPTWGSDREGGAWLFVADQLSGTLTTDEATLAFEGRNVSERLGYQVAIVPSFDGVGAPDLAVAAQESGTSPFGTVSMFLGD